MLALAGTEHALSRMTAEDSAWTSSPKVAAGTAGHFDDQIEAVAQRPGEPAAIA